jgi:type I restriction enzyme S subunit
MPRGNIQRLLDYEFNLPDLPTQHRIAAILGSIDEKIELNRKKIAELEALAKTIYDYWFVQFDFPDKNGKPYKSSGGKMVWNEQLKREIPEGWEVKSIGSIETNIVTGKTPNTDDATNFGNDIPFLTIDDLRGHVYTFTSQRSLSEKGAKLQSSKFIPPNSLCISCIRTIGEISFSAKCSQTNQQINSIVFDDDNYREYIYFNLKQYFRSAIVKTGNTFANMNKGEFARILCLVPSKQTLACFHIVAQSIFKQLKNMEQQIMLQIEVRELLLPLLMNGQVEVKV